MSGKSEETKETPQQRAMVQLALQEVQDYKARWLPLQKNLAATIAETGKAGSRARTAARGAAATSVEAKFSGAREGLESKLAQTGGLSSGRGKLAIAGMGDDQATATAMGLTNAEQQVDDAYVSGLNTLMSLGHGQKAGAVQGLSNQAAMSGRQATEDARASLENRMGNAQLVGQFAGMGAGLMKGAPPGVPGTNDLPGVNGSNALDQWTRMGVGAD